MFTFLAHCFVLERVALISSYRLAYGYFLVDFIVESDCFWLVSFLIPNLANTFPGDLFVPLAHHRKQPASCSSTCSPCHSCDHFLLRGCNLWNNVSFTIWWWVFFIVFPSKYCSSTRFDMLRILFPFLRQRPNQMASGRWRLGASRDKHCLWMGCRHLFLLQHINFSFRVQRHVVHSPSGKYGVTMAPRSNVRFPSLVLWSLFWITLSISWWLTDIPGHGSHIDRSARTRTDGQLINRWRCSRRRLLHLRRRQSWLWARFEFCWWSPPRCTGWRVCPPPSQTQRELQAFVFNLFHLDGHSCRGDQFSYFCRLPFSKFILIVSTRRFTFFLTGPMNYLVC